MSGNKISQAIIRAAIEKGIEDIKENPARGIRNLVDLGELYASGKIQKDFFLRAQTELSNTNSAYYKLVERVLCGTNTQLLLSFGMNLAYNSWTYGARQIRQIEEQQGFNVPWTLNFNLASWQVIDPVLLTSAIKQGKNIGIHCYIFYAGSNQRAGEVILKTMASHSDCSAIVFLSPQLSTAQLIAGLLKTKNVMVVLDMDKDSALAASKAQELKANGCLYGISHSYSSYPKAAEAEQLLDFAVMNSAPFLFLLDSNKNCPLTAKADSPVLNWREPLATPTFPSDFLADIALVDKNISSQASLAWVLQNGTVEACGENGQIVTNQESLYTTPLHKILASLLPKYQQNLA